MKVIVDRIEGEFVIVEVDVGQTLNIPKRLVPNAQEGDLIEINVKKCQNQVKKNVDNLINNLFED